MSVLKVLFLLLLCGCFVTESYSQKEQIIHSLKFLSEFDIPHKMAFKGTTIGGLSSIDYDKKRNVYYIISDDRSSINPARFYTAKIRISSTKIDSVIFTNVTSLKQADGTVYPNSKQDPYHTPDPEGLRYNAGNNELVWTSEGERIVKPGLSVLEDPAITIIKENGQFIDTFPLPSNMHMQAIEKGPRQNGVFEGLAFSGDYKTLYVNVEEPIYEDGYRAGLGDSTGWIRIIKYNVATKKPVAEYAYKIDAVPNPPIVPGAFKINGVPDILWIGQDKFLVTERSFSTGNLKCVIKVYIADLSQATNIMDVSSLRSSSHFRPIEKKLLLNMNDLHIYIDNIEGATFGPVLPNGNRSLLFISDDNFAAFQKTQILLFEVK
ncbi:MAG TPA: esterase-like activity of phytase family protein [Flavisolibacter sp.]|nr:esterase-like activity of phytase family protein [Flavisolibacter sp.]